MIDTKSVTPDAIRAAAGALREIRPEYKGILEFFEKLFLAQEASKHRIDMDPPAISEDMLAVKTKENFPLVGMNQFAVDWDCAKDLFVEIWELVGKSQSQMSFMALDLDQALESGKLKPENLIRAVLGGDEAFMESAAAEFKADMQLLGFLAYNAIKPSVVIGAEQLANFLDEKKPWPKGYCPVCGNYPGFGLLEGEGGNLHFFCSFCWHKWRSKRLFCPFCESEDNEGFHYFYSEAEPEYRVYVCDRCKKYVKTLDARIVNRPIHPPLETIATLHLDIKAKEDGLGSPPFGF